jgi:hypothetical protein
MVVYDETAELLWVGSFVKSFTIIFPRRAVANLGAYGEFAAAPAFERQSRGDRRHDFPAADFGVPGRR